MLLWITDGTVRLGPEYNVMWVVRGTNASAKLGRMQEGKWEETENWVPFSLVVCPSVLLVWEGCFNTCLSPPFSCVSSCFSHCVLHFPWFLVVFVACSPLIFGTSNKRSASPSKSASVIVWEGSNPTVYSNCATL